MRWCLKIMFVCMVVTGYGANVKWNKAFIEVFPCPDGEHAMNVSLGAPPYLPMWGDIDVQSGKLVLSATMFTFMEYANTFVLASFGEVVDQNYMNEQSEYFSYAKYGEEDSGRSDYSIILGEDDFVYLAFMNETSGGQRFGWVQIGLEEDVLRVLGSAWDVDGGAMYVGGGAVPEPTGAMLALVGMALLALRRKRSLRGLELEVTK